MYMKTKLSKIGVYLNMFTWPLGQYMEKVRGSQRFKLFLLIYY